jgi:iron complex outermembrane receptor protein
MQKKVGKTDHLIHSFGMISVTRDANQLITEIQTGSINQVGITTSGIDLELSAKFETDSMGTFSYKFNSSYLLEYETQATPNAERYDEVDSSTTPEYRFNTSLGYTIADFNAKLTYRFIPTRSDLSAVEKVADEKLDESKEGKVESWGVIDVNFNYDFADYGIVALGVRNIADKMPVLNLRLGDGFDTNNHDLEGRVLYGSYTITF